MPNAQTPPEITLISGDIGLSEIIGERLQEWGLVPRLIEDVALLTSGHSQLESTGVVILDIRREAEPALRWLREIRSINPTTEVILVNNSDRLTTSLEGMRSGAAAELTVPIDLGEMRRVLMTALSKISDRLGSKRCSNFSRFFRQTMTAITYAQAGEFETAMYFMNNQENQPAKPQTRGKR